MCSHFLRKQTEYEILYVKDFMKNVTTGMFIKFTEKLIDRPGVRIISLDSTLLQTELKTPFQPSPACKCYTCIWGVESVLCDACWTHGTRYRSMGGRTGYIRILGEGDRYMNHSVLVNFYLSD